MASNVFYSISPFGTGDIKVACNISISGGAGVATFSVAQTGNIGVGCHVISANVDGFISVMTNSTTATIVSALGVAHGNVSSESLTSIAHEYASLSAAEAGFTDANHINNLSLVAADVVVNLACYYDHDDDTVDSTMVVITGQTVDATRYLRVYTPQGSTESINDQRHSGVWSTNVYRLEASISGILIDPALAYTKLEGLQFYNTNSGNCQCVRSDTATAGRQIINSITRGNPSATGEVSGIVLPDAGATDTVVVNCICFDHESTGSGWGIYLRCADSGAPAKIYNCTIIDSIIGIRGRGGQVIVKNTISFGCTTAYLDSGFDTTNSTNNAGDVAAASIPGSNSVDVSADAATDLFIDPTNDDFHIANTSSNLYDAGTDLSSDPEYAFSDDIDGDTRSGTWDIGADEFVAVGFVPFPNPRYSLDSGMQPMNGGNL